jgi:acyl-CoA synthetase (AMP-forming)/AMP-acid ligase II
MVINQIYAHAANAPERPAIVWNGHPISYAVLARNIEITRARLAMFDIAPGSFAAISIATQLDAWCAMLAARCLGLHALVLRTPDQIAQLALPGPVTVITLAAAPPLTLAEAAALGGARLICIPPEIYRQSGEAGAAAALPAESDVGGYILLTSGTTGVYKKILIDCAVETMRARAINDIYDVSPATLAYLPGLGLWTAGGHNRTIAIWHAGGAVVIEETLDITAPLRRGGVTDLVLVPATLQSLLETPTVSFRRNDAMSVFLVGSAAPWTLVRQAKRRLSRRIFSELASTEAGTIAVTRLIEPADQRRHAVLASRRVEIVTEAGACAPRGEVGLVRIRMRAGDIAGYLDAPAASEAFFRDGYFYPGDLGAIAGDERLELHGRATDVISVNGDKVATAAIERVLEREFAARAVCVFATPDESGGDELHVVVETVAPVKSAGASRLAARFPSFAAVRLHAVARMPRNDMGKIDRLEVQRQVAAHVIS